VTDRLEDLPPGAFSLVTLDHVFEHLANPVEVLDGVRRFLAPQGRLYVEVPNARSLRARLALPLLTRRFRVDERYRAYPIHLIYYSDRTLRGMLGKAGWVVEKTFTSGIGLNEFLVSPDTPQEQTTRPGDSRRVAAPPKRRLRHLLRDAFLGLGAGENLSAIAYPVRS
jgi:hypothetical protein